ncbi:MAG: AAA family ATPase [Oscillospiraceae bacterium]|nr:AAA family ATPase [Oscillospiraceae bacterium]
MGKFVKGDIVVLSYPFSDFSGTKRRPALVIADLDGDDVILCQIISQAKKDRYALNLEDTDFTDGKLNTASFVRPNKIFTADSNIILYTACKISSEKTDIVINAIFDIINFKTENKRKGKIIILNGVSSSGKTTLAKILQERLTEPFWYLGGDVFIDMMPDKFFDDHAVGKAISHFHHAIKSFSDRAFNTIVDCLFEEIAWLEECVGLLHDYSVMFVHVTCPLEELRRKEKERGDRGIGQAEAQIPLLNPKDNIYDITVDTFENSSEECAAKIVKLMDYPEKCTAFETLWKQRSK